MNPFLGIALVMTALGVLLPVVKAWRARQQASGETARKMVHLGMGCVCLTFPWLFREIWPVWILGGLALSVLLSVRLIGPLRRELGGVLHDVKRSSKGELYFPIGVAAVFTLCRGEALPYVIAVALLTFADSAGAIIGMRWGRRKYATLEGEKSLEGSLAVGVTGFLFTAAPLLASGIEWREALVIGVMIGLFSLMLEAISWRGLDNIFLPLAAYAQISVYLHTPLPSLLAKLGVLISLTAVGLFWRRGQVVDDSARLGAALAMYFFWAVGGWHWLVAPLVLLASYVRLMPTVPGGMPRHNLVAVICVGSVGLVWCVAQAFAPRPLWLALFTIGIATHQAVIAIVRYSQARPQWPRTAWWSVGVGQAVLTQGLAYALMEREQPGIGIAILVGVGCVALASAVFVVVERHLQLPQDISLRWWKQGAVAVMASGVGLVLVKL